MISLPSPRQLEWVVPIAAIAITVTMTIATANALPERIATAWSGSGQPSRHAMREWELFLGILVVALGASFVAVADQLHAGLAQRALVAFGHAVAVGWATYRLRTIAANLHVEHWSDAAPTVGLPVVAVSAIAAGLAGWLISRHRCRSRTS